MKKMIKKLRAKTTASKRNPIWSIDEGWMCSVLGTCFRRSEIRKFARKKQFGLDPGDNDFMLHTALIKQLLTRNPASRALNRTLEEKYIDSVKRYAGASEDHAIKRLWEEDILRGNVPGAYWAIVSHPSASRELVGEIFGEVHMMGHDTHGDYQRDNTALTMLKEKVVLLEEIMGNERRLHLKEQNALKNEISDLSVIEKLYIDFKAENKKLKAQLDRDTFERCGQGGVKQELDELRENNANLIGRIDELTTELEKLQQQMDKERRSAARLKEEQEKLTIENEQLRQENLALETNMVMQMSMDRGCANCEDQSTNKCPGPDLCGKTVLYVGGRQNLVPMYKKLIEELGGGFLHHDGGVETARTKLPKMLTSADLVVCPVDCVSHDASNCVKKICQRYLKPFVMMRSSGLSSLARGLSTVVQ